MRGFNKGDVMCYVFLKQMADFGAKSDGLRAYIAQLRKAGRKVFGGIVANTDPVHYTGQWMLYEGEGKDVKEDDWKGWARLEV